MVNLRNIFGKKGDYAEFEEVNDNTALHKLQAGALPCSYAGAGKATHQCLEPYRQNH